MRSMGKKRSRSSSRHHRHQDSREHDRHSRSSRRRSKSQSRSSSRSSSPSYSSSSSRSRSSSRSKSRSKSRSRSRSRSRERRRNNGSEKKVSAFDSMDPPDRRKTSSSGGSSSRFLTKEWMNRETRGGRGGGRLFRDNKTKSERDDQRTTSDDVFSSDLRAEFDSLISKLNYDRNRIGSTMVFCLENVKHSEIVCFPVPSFFLSNLHL